MHKKLEMFFSVSIDLFCISSFDGHFKRVNLAFEQTLGYSAEELCTKSYLDFIHPDDIEKTKQEVEKQLKTGQSVFDFENRYRCADGSYKLLTWKSRPVGDLMYACARDITESKKKEVELKKAQQDIETANRELKAFSYMVAHDLRAPLRSMAGFSTALLEDFNRQLNEEGRSYIHRIVENSKKMENLIDALLNFSRFTKQEITKTPVNLSAMAKSITTELQKTQPDREVIFNIAENVVANAESILINQVLTNLLSNAWKYTSKSRTVAKIDFGISKSDNEEAVYFVRDNGVGFEMKYANKLFEAFQRLHSQAEFEGTGLGLATAQKIISRHGGKIWANSEPGKGTTFFFTI